MVWLAICDLRFSLHSVYPVSLTIIQDFGLHGRGRLRLLGGKVQGPAPDGSVYRRLSPEKRITRRPEKPHRQFRLAHPLETGPRYNDPACRYTDTTDTAGPAGTGAECIVCLILFLFREL